MFSYYSAMVLDTQDERKNRFGLETTSDGAKYQSHT